jgi:hypothetical protein
MQIHPRLGGTTTPVAWDLLLWCAPGQPYRVHVHTWPDLSLTDQRLVPWRETLIDFRMLGNTLACGSTTGEKQRGGCYPECQRAPRDSTLHSATTIRFLEVESMTVNS